MTVLRSLWCATSNVSEKDVAQKTPEESAAVEEEGEEDNDTDDDCEEEREDEKQVRQRVHELLHLASALFQTCRPSRTCRTR